MKVTAYAYRKDGQIILRNRAHILKEIEPFGNAELEIVIQKKIQNRSIQQNRLWWAIMAIVGKEIGMRKEELHEVCKYKFLKREMVIPTTGEVVEYLESTTKLDKVEFGELIEKLTIWAGEMGITIPQAGEQITAF
jgi:hypothetical protein